MYIWITSVFVTRLLRGILLEAEPMRPQAATSIEGILVLHGSRSPGGVTFMVILSRATRGLQKALRTVAAAPQPTPSPTASPSPWLSPGEGGQGGRRGRRAGGRGGYVRRGGRWLWGSREVVRRMVWVTLTARVSRGGWDAGRSRICAAAKNSNMVRMVQREDDL